MRYNYHREAKTCWKYAQQHNVYTVLVLIKLTKFAVALRLRWGSCKLIFYIISSFFANLKNVVHSLEPGETPSNSASHQAQNNVQIIWKRFGAVAVSVIFSIYLKLAL